jgi:hypothetical protein
MLSHPADAVAKRRGIGFFDAIDWLARHVRNARSKPRPRARARARRRSQHARRVERDDGGGGSDPAPGLTRSAALELEGVAR